MTESENTLDDIAELGERHFTEPEPIVYCITTSLDLILA